MVAKFPNFNKQYQQAPKSYKYSDGRSTLLFHTFRNVKKCPFEIVITLTKSCLQMSTCRKFHRKKRVENIRSQFAVRQLDKHYMYYYKF